MVSSRRLMLALKHPRKGYDLYNPITGRVVGPDSPAMKKLLKHIAAVSEKEFVQEISNRNPKLDVVTVNKIAERWIAMAIKAGAAGRQSQKSKSRDVSKVKEKKKGSKAKDDEKKKKGSKKKTTAAMSPKSSKALEDCQKEVKRLQQRLAEDALSGPTPLGAKRAAQFIGRAEAVAAKRKTPTKKPTREMSDAEFEKATKALEARKANKAAKPGKILIGDQSSSSPEAAAAAAVPCPKPKKRKIAFSESPSAPKAKKSRKGSAPRIED